MENLRVCTTFRQRSLESDFVLYILNDFSDISFAFRAALITDLMYRRVIVGLLLVLRVCHGKTRNASLTSCHKCFIVESCCLTRLEGLINSCLEMKVHEVWWLVAGGFSFMC